MFSGVAVLQCGKTEANCKLSRVYCSTPTRRPCVRRVGRVEDEELDLSDCTHLLDSVRKLAFTSSSKTSDNPADDKMTCAEGRKIV